MYEKLQLLPPAVVHLLTVSDGQASLDEKSKAKIVGTV